MAKANKQPVVDTTVTDTNTVVDTVVDTNPTTQVETDAQVQLEDTAATVTDEVKEPTLDSVPNDVQEDTNVQEPETIQQEPETIVAPEQVEDSEEVDPLVEIQRVITLINDATLSPESKLDQVAVSKFLAISIVGGRLKDYKEDMHRDRGLMDLKQGANKNSQLYKSIMAILKQEDDEIFKAGFNLINIIFKSFGGEDEAFNHYLLARYDAGWDNQKDLATYNKLCVVITTLADAKTREELKTTIDFNKLRDKDKTNFTDKIVDRLVSYYGI